MKLPSSFSIPRCSSPIVWKTRRKNRQINKAPGRRSGIVWKWRFAAVADDDANFPHIPKVTNGGGQVIRPIGEGNFAAFPWKSWNRWITVHGGIVGCFLRFGNLHFFTDGAKNLVDAKEKKKLRKLTELMAVWTGSKQQTCSRLELASV